jgi:hypothetical protein
MSKFFADKFLRKKAPPRKAFPNTWTATVQFRIRKILFKIPNGNIYGRYIFYMGRSTSL